MLGVQQSICLYICLYYTFVLSHLSVQLCATPWTVALQTPLSMGSSPGKNTRVGCHSLLQGIFSRGSNPCLLGLLHWQMSALAPAPPGKPQIIHLVDPKPNTSLLPLSHAHPAFPLAQAHFVG